MWKKMKLKKKKENGAGHYNCVQIHKALMKVELILYNPNVGSLNHSWSCTIYFYAVNQSECKIIHCYLENRQGDNIEHLLHTKCFMCIN